ncbi:MAG: S1 family peptidase [Gammaproteobacteria bacterium]
MAPEPVDIVPIVRESVAAILRVHPLERKRGEKGPAKFGAAISGSAFCVLENRYLLTAHHVLGDGKTREAADRFFAFTVPGNQRAAHFFPVTGFPLERPDLDLAVLEIGPCATPGIGIPALPVTDAEQADGTRVVTLGFPAPEIVRVNVDAQGNYQGGEFFLKSHANAGIVSAAYSIGEIPFYELSVGWHHGESGGPVATLANPPAAFSLMQHYRNIRSPHGVMAGPHRGRALAAIRSELEALGVPVI